MKTYMYFVVGKFILSIHTAPKLPRMEIILTYRPEKIAALDFYLGRIGKCLGVCPCYLTNKNNDY